MALTIRVGQVMGAGQAGLVRPICSQAILGTTLMMLCFASVFLILRKVIGYAFVDDQAVIALTAQLFFAVAAFQVFDGWQVVCVGALRGLADVRVPFVFTLVAYWLVALPLAYFLGYKLWGAIGVWIALLTGLAVVSLPLIIRLWWKTKPGNLPTLTVKSDPLPEGGLL
jgi:MATE family multidrug resistance protein